MKSIIFHLLLRPLIVRNYEKRRKMAKAAFETGYGPIYEHDRWYWADRLAAKWGYYVRSR